MKFLLNVPVATKFKQFLQSKNCTYLFVLHATHFLLENRKLSILLVAFKNSKRNTPRKKKNQKKDHERSQLNKALVDHNVSLWCGLIKIYGPVPCFSGGRVFFRRISQYALRYTQYALNNGYFVLRAAYCVLRAAYCVNERLLPTRNLRSSRG